LSLTEDGKKILYFPPNSLIGDFAKNKIIFVADKSVASGTNLIN